MKTKLQALVLDMDGLLLDTEPVYERVWRDSLASAGYSLTHDMFLQLLGRGRKGALAKVSELFGPALSQEALNVELSRREALYFEEAPVQVKPGAHELLEFAVQHNLMRIVATSTRRDVAQKRLASSKLIAFFNDLVGGDEVSQSKPAPDIFLAAAKKLGVEPQHCVVLEDSEMGVRGAHAAGMTPIMIPDLLEPSVHIRAIARVILPSLHAVPGWLGDCFEISIS